MAGHVILVPGLLGTELVFLNALKQQVAFWVDKVLIARDGLLPMALDFDGDKPLPGKGLALEPEYIYGDTYSALRVKLRDGAPSDFTKSLFTYDWRKDPIRVGKALADSIRQICNPNKPCYIVAHSLGGIVAKIAWSELKVTNQTNLIKRIVTIGTPHSGCYSVADVYGMRDPLCNDLARLSKLLSLSGTWAVTTDGDKLRMKNDVIRTINTWPSVYATMPMNSSAAVTNDPLALKWYDVGNLPTDLWIDRNWMTWAQTTWLSYYWASNSLPPSETLMCIAGSGIQTAQRINQPAALLNAAGYIWTDAGDGTVSVWSALSMSANKLVVPGEHALLPRHPQILDGIWGWLLTDWLPPLDPPDNSKLIDQAKTEVPVPQYTVPFEYFMPQYQNQPPGAAGPGPCVAGGCKC